MRKLFALFLVLAASVGTLFAESGTCGPDLTWFYNPSDNSLTITGTGPMTNYSQDNYAPWYDYKDKITSLKLESGMTTIGDYAFYMLSLVKDANIPEGVTSIGNFAFGGCAALNSLYIPYGVKTIGQSAFAFCGSLETVYMPYGVTSIGGAAFGVCANLKNVAIPATVKTIGDQAFYYCSALRNIANFATNPQSINANVFEGVDKMNCSLYVPKYAQANYNKPTWIEFSKETITSNSSVGSFNFSFDFENGILTITGTGLLPEIEGYFTSPQIDAMMRGQIVHLSFPSGLTGIGQYNFLNYFALTSLKIPYGVSILKENAFTGCNALETVEIPSSTAIIEDYVFYDCYSLKTVYNLATVPQSINANVFGGVDISKCTLYMPQGCKAAYEAAPVWKDFIIKEMAKPEAIEQTINHKQQTTNNKLIKDGQLFILRDNELFNAQGARVE